MPEETTAAALVAKEARIAVDGVVAIDRLSVATEGARVVVAGDASALIAALTCVPMSQSGRARAGVDAALSPRAARVRASAPSDGDDVAPGESFVVAGSLHLAGRNVADGSHVAVMGAAPLDPGIPMRWTVEEYIGWSARLAGAEPKHTKELAQAALARVDLVSLASKHVVTLPLAERRAVVLAQASVMAPEVIVAEAPLSGLEGAPAALVLRALGGVADKRLAVVSATRLDPGSLEHVLAREATHLLVLAAGDLALQGRPGDLFAGARVYGLSIRTNAEPMRAELAARGITLQGGPVRFSAMLPEGRSTRDILAAAQAASAAVVSLVPILG